MRGCKYQLGHMWAIPCTNAFCSFFVKNIPYSAAKWPMGHSFIGALLKVGSGHLCEILKWLAKICDICPGFGVGYNAAVGHFVAEYGNYLG